MIYHLASAAEWATAASDGVYETGSLQSEGFIHCSTASQYTATAARVFPGRSDLLLLTIDETLLLSPVRHEEGERGVLYPHIYGPINLNAVVSAEPYDQRPLSSSVVEDHSSRPLGRRVQGQQDEI